jgi:hypothetical protein
MINLYYLLFAAFLLLPATIQAQLTVSDAQECFAQLDYSDNYGESLNSLDLNYLPAGLKKTVGNMDVTLAVNSADFTAGYTLLGVYLRIKIPEQNRTLFFGAKGIKLSYGGDVLGNATVTLLEDLEVPFAGDNIILRFKGDYNGNTGDSEDLTFATIDCNGLKEIGVSAEAEFSSSLCLPVDAEGNAISGGKVKGAFKTRISDWNDIMLQISFQPFMLTGLDGFIWTVKDATFDFSDKQTPQGIFPEKYRPYLIPGQENLWRGVHISDLTVTLPPQFSKKGDLRTSFDARNMLIDDNGVTGVFSVEGNLLSLGEGNASGWAFSVERFAMTLLASSLESAEFDGQVRLPVSDRTTLRYEGLIGANNKYLLRVQQADSLSFDFLGATAQLDPNSYVEFKLENKRFKPEALLHGRMGIDVKLNPDDGKGIARFKGVEFRSLRLKTENPRLTVEYLGYSGEVKLMNFPLSVDGIALTANDRKVTLGINAKLSLGDVFTGSTRIEIAGALSDGEIQRWQYDHVEISRINVDTRIAEVFFLKGKLDILRNDPVYGDGVGGKLEMGFDKVLKGLKITVRGMFGRTDFQYWFVDGMAELPGAGIPVFPSFNLTGFGGGVSYRMKPDLSRSGGSPVSSTSITYVPDANVSLGIKASVMFAVPKKEVINGEATFELSFNHKGGLSYAGFYGCAKFVGALPGTENFQKVANEKYRTALKKEQEFTDGNPAMVEKLKQWKQYNPNEAASAITDNSRVQGQSGIMATAGIQFNFAESSFHATFELYVNMLGGFMRGTGSGNRAGYAVMHIDPDEWYVHIGTPSDRIGLKMGMGGLSVETGAYLMVGTNIPAAPGVPPQVADILGESPENLNYMSGLNSLGEGKGFAFGANLSISTGDITFLILYANYSMGMGFDIMLKDYGEAQCQGRSGAIGMDGWYANGQAYAYMHGELGVKVNLWFMKARLPIITADVAALMQAMLPNPSSFKAYLAAKASLLGGLVNVNCRFKISIGEVCDLVIPGGSPLEMEMIADMSPDDGSGEASVFTAPQTTFNMAVGKSFSVQDDDGEKTFRIQLQEFVLSDGTNIAGKLKWNSAKDAVSFYSHEILPPQKDITATVKVVFEEWKNGRWNRVYTAGREAVEAKTVHFSTSDAPRDIPAQNVLYAYPVIDQKYFLKDETKAGYIQLQYGQSYLFPADMENRVVYEDGRGNRQSAAFVYDASRKRIEYTVPALDNSAAYSVSIISFSRGEEASAGEDVSVTSMTAGEGEGGIDVSRRQASAETRTDVGKTLLSYSFAASAYSTFAEKLGAIRKKEAVVVKLSSDLLMFKYETEDMEPFDLADLTGTDRTENLPLVRAVATLDDYYYREKIYPLLYRDYPVSGYFRVSRTDTETTGIPPAGALPLDGAYLGKIENGDFTGAARNIFPYRYNLPQYYKLDFTDLQNQAINHYLQTGAYADACRRFSVAVFPFISAGQYRISLQYVMPGGMKGTGGTFEYRNFIQ